MRQQSVTARRAVVASADQLATQAGLSMIGAGGTAVDAAIATNAVLAVTAPHLCGMGGDLLAIVRSPDGEVIGLNASGRAGSGSDPEALRSEGHRSMPFHHDIRTVTVPGCVDGWVALHERFATMDLADVLRPAHALAADGFAASPLLAGSVVRLDVAGRTALDELAGQATSAGAAVRRPGVALTLQAIARGGRQAFYDGAFGEGLVALGDGLFGDDDLQRSHADWVDVLRTNVFGVELIGFAPNSQGYLTLAIADIAESAGLPDDPDDPEWIHRFVEAATAASHDRPQVLHEGADGAELLALAGGRADLVSTDRASVRPSPGATGDTTYLCTADSAGWAVSLIQSNAAGFGSQLVEPTTGINLHNRGLGFSLIAGSAAELGPGRRPPHTLSPSMAQRDGELAAVLGTMGGDAQPQIVAQLAARLFRHGADAAAAIGAPRWVLRGPRTGFDTWTEASPTVVLEEGVPGPWLGDLVARGHDVAMAPSGDGSFGHAHCIVAGPAGLTAAADWRTLVGSAAGVSW